MELLLGLVVLILCIVIYFLPTIIASRSGHKNVLAIFALNLLGGWTMICWVIALIWSLLK